MPMGDGRWRRFTHALMHPLTHALTHLHIHCFRLTDYPPRVQPFSQKHTSASGHAAEAAPTRLRKRASPKAARLPRVRGGSVRKITIPFVDRKVLVMRPRFTKCGARGQATFVWSTSPRGLDGDPPPTQASYTGRPLQRAPPLTHTSGPSDVPTACVHPSLS